MSSRSVSEGEIVNNKKATTTSGGQNQSVNSRLRADLSPSPEAQAPTNSASIPYSHERQRQMRSTSPWRQREMRSTSPWRQSQPHRGREQDIRDDHSRGQQHSRNDYPRRDRHRSPDRRAPQEHSDHRSDARRVDRGRDYRMDDAEARSNHRAGDRFDERDQRDSNSRRDGWTDRGDYNGTTGADRHENREDNSRKRRRSRTPVSEDRKHTVNPQRLVPRENNETAPRSRTGIDGTTTKTELSAEERRKKREEIKARHQRSQDLIRNAALGTRASSIATLGSPTPPPMSPAFPPGKTSAESTAALPPPINVSNDFQLANNVESVTTGEPELEQVSAVDYEFQMDGAGDTKTPGNENVKEMPASAYDETMEKDKKVMIGEVTKEEKLDVDMFADDGDDDMFAAPAHTRTEPTGVIAGHNLASRTLDQNLLDNWDDPDSYYRVIPGEILDGRYHVRQILGKGVFANVVAATDTTNQLAVAIKIIRSIDMMTKVADKEISYLQRLGDADPEGKKHIIKLERSFNHKGHLCMVFEQLSDNLRDVLKKFGRDVGIQLRPVRSYAHQMFVGLAHLQKCDVVHLDLKPDNILVDGTRSVLKLCDLGSAVDSFDGNKISDEVVSRFYRAPEIILGMGFDFAVDMWSIGCTLFEMYTGKILFPGRDNNHMLKVIMECRGKFSLKMLKKGEFSGNHFDDSNSLDFKSQEVDRVTGKVTVKLLNFTKPIKDLKERLMAVAQATAEGGKMSDADVKEVYMFADLLDKCLALNPEKRIKPADALKHPFIYRQPHPFGSGK